MKGSMRWKPGPLVEVSSAPPLRREGTGRETRPSAAAPHRAGPRSAGPGGDRSGRLTGNRRRCGPPRSCGWRRGRRRPSSRGTERRRPPAGPCPASAGRGCRCPPAARHQPAPAAARGEPPGGAAGPGDPGAAGSRPAGVSTQPHLMRRGRCGGTAGPAASRVGVEDGESPSQEVLL